ncbi:hypothetical protein [Streptomyces sp. H-KF8]|uniref:hypothetical protein n=1 Tax=Streptomyces sp. H-KF8 TaxID=1727216 RepID=UPI000A9A61E9|nr:hypothetical protein [Streptomyces sp. H-KF8]
MKSSASSRALRQWFPRAGAGALVSLFCLFCVLGLGLAVPGPARAADGDDGGRTGKLTIEVEWDASRQEVAVRERCTYTLAPDSEALAALRNEGAGFCAGYTVLRDGEEPDNDGWGNPADRVTQESSRGPARVETEFVLYLARHSGQQNLTVGVDPSSALEDAPQGLPEVWTVEVSAPRWSFGKIRGPVASQSPGKVGWRVTTGTKDGADFVRSVDLSRAVKATKPPTERQQTRAEMVTAFALAACGIAVVAALLVARLVGPAVARRWATATMLLAVIAYPLAFFGTPRPLLPPNTTMVPISIGFGGGPPPGDVWKPGPVLGLWLWYVLPVAGWWFSRRLVTRKPPSRPVLVVSSAAPLLVLPFLTADGVVPHPAVWGVLAAMGTYALSVTFFLRRSTGSGAGRRWAATAGALIWVALVTFWLGHVPVMSDEDPSVTGFETAAVLVCTWPAAAWITSLLGPVRGRTPRPVVRAVCFVVLWALMLSPFLVARATEPGRAFDPWNSYRGPLFTGYTGFPLCVVAVCGVALQLVYLFRRGRLGDRGRAVEPVGRLLLVCGVLMALGNPSLRTLSMWGDALAVLWVAIGSLVLIPPGSDATAAKFRHVGRAAHARFMDRWVRTQLLWDTRADFQRAARSALAEDMPVPDFSRRWTDLDVPGRCGDPAARLARAKRFALGSSAGIAPRTAGLAGAALVQLLALPWAGYKLITGEAVGADGFMPFFLDEISRALRFGHWALYGFVFGYFYALLRGRTPIGKAAALMAVVLPAEALSMLPLTMDPQYTRNPSWTDTAVACGGLAGQTFVVCMVLGLFWEWWLARAAALKWSQVRNFRRLSSVTVPLGTVLVAAATAFATVVAGAWAQQELQPPSGSPSPSPSQSAPVQPGQPAP